MKNFRLICYCIFVVALLFMSSCKSDYITYYRKVNEIDSTYRIANQPEEAVRKFRKLFRRYEPKNQERIEEYETYIRLADRQHQNFGGKKSLIKLIPLIAPYNDDYKKLYYPLYQKYGIDSTEVKQKITEWKKGLNQKLIDSFAIAMIRDQEGRPDNKALVKKNVKKNAELLIWTFKNYGFPTMQKIGSFPMTTFLTHMNESEQYYPYIKTQLLEYIKSGDCLPRDYMLMVDNPNYMHNKETMYIYNPGISKDSAQINRNRKSIGLPSLKHSAIIRKDFFRKIKLE